METTRVLRDLQVENIATTFGFPFFHTLGDGTTERAFTAALGGSRNHNKGAPNFKFWEMLNLIWNRARDAGWFTSFSSETCFTQEHQSLFLNNTELSHAEMLLALGDHIMYDAFCGSGTGQPFYRDGNYYVKNFLGEERSCEGGRRPSSNFLEFTQKVMNSYLGSNGEKMYPSFHVFEWASAHLFREEYHVCAAQHHLDSSFAAFLRALKSSGAMNHTMLVISGDHSNWYIEEKPNAAVSITVPDWFLDLEPTKSDTEGDKEANKEGSAKKNNIRENLHKNQQEVVTHLDLHATMMALIEQQTGPHPLVVGVDDDAFSFPTPPEGKVVISTVHKGRTWTGWRYGQPTFPGKNLFFPLPFDRGCKRAGVDQENPSYCLIKSFKMAKIEELNTRVESDVAFHTLLNQAITRALNSNVRDELRPTCKKYAFHSLLSVKARNLGDSMNDGKFKLTVSFNVQPFSSAAGRREFQCIAWSTKNPFELGLGGGGGTVEASPQQCSQASKWEMNKKCMPKGIKKREQDFCQCLDDVGVVIEGFRL